MRLRLAGGLDLATVALIVGGAVLVAASIVLGSILLAPPPSNDPTRLEQPVAVPPATRPSAALAPGQVASVLHVEAGLGAGGVTRSGDHVDILSYFSRQVSGSENVTRTLLSDVTVLAVDRSGASVTLTLALPQSDAVLLQEAEALGGRPFVTLRSAQPPTATVKTSFSDADLAARMAGGQ